MPESDLFPIDLYSKFEFRRFQIGQEKATRGYLEEKRTTALRSEFVRRRTKEYTQADTVLNQKLIELKSNPGDEAKEKEAQRLSEQRRIAGEGNPKVQALRAKLSQVKQRAESSVETLYDSGSAKSDYLAWKVKKDTEDTALGHFEGANLLKNLFDTAKGVVTTTHPSLI